MSAVQHARSTKNKVEKSSGPSGPEDQRRLFDALDLLQKQRAEATARTNTVLDVSSREEQMLESLRQLHQSRGEVVNEEELREAVRATREPTNLVYRPLTSGVTHSLVNAYLARAKWFPHSMIAIALSAVLWGGVSWRTQAVEQAFQETVLSSAASLDQISTRRKGLDVVAARWPQGPGQAVHRSNFDRALAQADETIVAAQAVLASPTKDTVEEAVALIEKSSLALAAAVAAQADAQTQVELSARAKQVASLPEDTSWPEVNIRRKSRQSELGLALAAGDLTQSRAALAAISTLSNASALRATLREATSLVPAEGQAEAQALRTRGEAALLNADTQSATAAISSLRELTDFIATSYTMKIVNEQGVKSGVWRHPNDNPSARNYYVVVDALDASGSPVRVRVVNEETGKSEVVSRFAVRVSEKMYESVKSDKMDNGLIDDALVGVKQAGKMKPQYNIDTAGGGIITQW